ncbi:MAG TPA: PDZ domain-containing protein [Kofleriaceae bacterium]|nr:PDZ domain-containing protein [Kofleriaceae bacterium]
MAERAPHPHGDPRLHRLAAIAAVVALVVAAIALVVVARRAPAVAEAPPVAAPADAGDPTLASITRLGATSFAVPATTIDAWLADPARIARGVTGARRVHEPDGVAIDGVRPGSVAAALGLEAGDVIRGINGAEVSDPAAIAPLIARSTGQISVDLWRRGATVILNYRNGR